MALICMFFPAIIMCGIRRIVVETYRNNRDSWKYSVFEYVCSCMFLNVLLWVFLAIFRHNREAIYDKLNISSIFAIKYLLSSVMAAVVVPFVERYMREKLIISVDVNVRMPSMRLSEWFSGMVSRYGIYVLAVVAVGMHFFRIFDNAFWYDEMLPLITERLGGWEMLRRVAGWGHTPLHYIIIWVLYRIVGDYGPMYHFASLVPYIIIVLTSVTLIRKWFGSRTAVIFILLSALLENAVRYNVEVRMYSWCQMFVFLAYLMLYQILCTKRTEYYLFMMLCSVGAVYSHIFALAPVGIMYLILLAYMVRTDRRSAWKVVLYGGMVLILFMPWIAYLYYVRGEVVAHYILSKVSWKSCLAYIFSSKYSFVILNMFVCIFIVVFLQETGILESQPAENKKTKIRVCLSPAQWKLSHENVWCLTGTLATFGTIAISQWISDILYPIINLRYLYPALILVWLVLGVFIAKCRINRLLTAVLVLILTISCIPAYVEVVKTENEIKDGLVRTLAVTQGIDQNDYIVTDLTYLNWPTVLYYYPGAESTSIKEPLLPQLRTDADNWLFLGSPISDALVRCAKEQGYSIEDVISEGIIGTYPVWIYKLVNE